MIANGQLSERRGFRDAFVLINGIFGPLPQAVSVGGTNPGMCEPQTAEPARSCTRTTGELATDALCRKDSVG